MRHSQYLDAYLDENAARMKVGDGPITIGTFLGLRLRGTAKNYIMKYVGALKRSCIAVGAVEVPSKGGGKAYVRKEKP